MISALMPSKIKTLYYLSYRMIIALMPSKIKIMYYRAMGAKIGKDCFIGFSFIDAKIVEIGDCRPRQSWIGNRPATLNFIEFVSKLDI
jgi:hypothetical protein